MPCDSQPSKQAGEDRMKAVLEERKRREANGGENERRPPQRWLKLYDKNKNRRIDEAEWEKARSNEVARVTKDFDKNSDQQLSKEERQSVSKFMRSKKHHGYDYYILRIVSGEERRSQGGHGKPEERWRRFDTDGNGIASTSELDAIRQFERQR